MAELTIIHHTGDPAGYLDLLLLADPSVDLIRAYLKKGLLFGAYRYARLVGAFVLLDKGAGCWELKNIAVSPDQQRKGIGACLLDHAADEAKRRGGVVLEVGTGNSSLGQLTFYEAAGFKRSSVDAGFFLREYAKPIFENGIQCVDMIMLSKPL